MKLHYDDPYPNVEETYECEKCGQFSLGVSRDDTVRLSAANPKAFLFVDVTDIPHPVPDAAGFSLVNFSERICFAASDVLGSDDVALDNQFPNLPRLTKLFYLVEVGDRFVGDRNNSPVDSGKF